jgi:hypothetical protein
MNKVPSSTIELSENNLCALLRERETGNRRQQEQVLVIPKAEETESNNNRQEDAFRPIGSLPTSTTNADEEKINGLPIHDYFVDDEYFLDDMGELNLDHYEEFSDEEDNLKLLEENCPFRLRKDSIDEYERRSYAKRHSRPQEKESALVSIFPR